LTPLGIVRDTVLFTPTTDEVEVEVVVVVVVVVSVIGDGGNVFTVGNDNNPKLLSPFEDEDDDDATVELVVLVVAIATTLLGDIDNGVRFLRRRFITIPFVPIFELPVVVVVVISP